MKTVTENTSFRKRSPLKDGAVFSNYCVFEWKGKKDSKTQRVDADFVKAEKKNPRFQAKTDTCGPGLRRWLRQLCKKPKQDDSVIKKTPRFTLPQLPLDPPSDCPLNPVAPNSDGRYSYLCAVEKD